MNRDYDSRDAPFTVVESAVEAGAVILHRRSKYSAPWEAMTPEYRDKVRGDAEAVLMEAEAAGWTPPGTEDAK